MMKLLDNERANVFLPATPISALINSIRWQFMCLVAGAAIIISCGEQPVNDPCCSYAHIPPGSDVSGGQGLLQVEGSSTAYFYVLNPQGQQVGRQTLNRTLTLDPGKYHIRLNNSSHTVEIRADQLAKCSTGTLIVSGSTAENYYVIDSLKQQLGSQTLGKSMSYFPGRYTVRLNNTEVSANVKLKELTEIRSGSINVRGTTNEYYYVLGSGNKQLNYNSLDKPLAFLPGVYEVKVNNTSRKAEVLSGTVTEFATGNLLIHGLTDEYYYVTDSLGNALNYQVLNKPLAFFPGKYEIKVNNTIIDGNVSADNTSEFRTGSLMLKGGGTGYYYVLDRLGNQLNYNTLNKSLSFFPSEYVVKLGATTRKATVTAGELTAISAFN